MDNGRRDYKSFLHWLRVQPMRGLDTDCKTFQNKGLRLRYKDEWIFNVLAKQIQCCISNPPGDKSRVIGDFSRVWRLVSFCRESFYSISGCCREPLFNLSVNIELVPLRLCDASYRSDCYTTATVTTTNNNDNVSLKEVGKMSKYKDLEVVRFTAQH